MKNLMGVMEGGSIPALSNLEEALKSEQKVLILSTFLAELLVIKLEYVDIVVSSNFGLLNSLLCCNRFFLHNSRGGHKLVPTPQLLQKKCSYIFPFSSNMPSRLWIPLVRGLANTSVRSNTHFYCMRWRNLFYYAFVFFDWTCP